MRKYQPKHRQYISSRLEEALIRIRHKFINCRGVRVPDSVQEIINLAEQAAEEWEKCKQESSPIHYPHAGQTVLVDIGNGIQEFKVNDWFFSTNLLNGTALDRYPEDPIRIYLKRLMRKEVCYSDDVLIGTIDGETTLIHLSEVVLNPFAGLSLPFITTLECTSYACPRQYEGWLSTGEKIYFRFRHGEGYVSINDKVILKFGDVLGNAGYMRDRHAMRYIKLAIARYLRGAK